MSQPLLPISISFALLLSLSSTIAQSDEGPSLQETVGWLENTWANHGGWVLSTNNKAALFIRGYMTRAENQKCLFFPHSAKVQDGIVDTNGRYLIIEVHRALDFSSLDPVSVRVIDDKFAAGVWFVHLESSGGVSSITTKTDFYKQTRIGLNECKQLSIGRANCAPFSGGWSEIEFERSEEGLIATDDLGFNEKERATRFANALKHAIKLCGGKVDPF